MGRDVGRDDGGESESDPEMSTTTTTSSSSSDPNHDECHICGFGGSLLCCDECPKAFHLNCIGLETNGVPEGEWSCGRCEEPERIQPGCKGQSEGETSIHR